MHVLLKKSNYALTYSVFCLRFCHCLHVWWLPPSFYDLFFDQSFYDLLITDFVLLPFLMLLFTYIFILPDIFLPNIKDGVDLYARAAARGKRVQVSLFFNLSRKCWWTSNSLDHLFEFSPHYFYFPFLWLLPV